MLFDKNCHYLTKIVMNLTNLQQKFNLFLRLRHNSVILACYNKIRRKLRTVNINLKILMFMI